ncbi:MAG: type 2 lanthipeptide synthetase LanM family protein [Nostoc sp.]|uniref:type 2 lanthipeptide synthetase LanM family protein n=1 Tax=Nostoc sp. TaxID=1180 RepID=UPI002FF4F250
MQFSQKDLIKIVEKASTINERLDSSFIFNEVAENKKIVNARLERWCQVATEGDWEKFKQRLALDNLDLNIARRAVGSVSFSDEQNLPAWIETLKEGIKATTLVSKESIKKGLIAEENRFLNPLEPFPFEEIWLPFIYIARNKLTAQTDTNYLMLAAEAHATLERTLLESLTTLSVQALATRFKVFQYQKQPAFIRTLGKITTTRSNEQYKLFIEEMLNGGLLSFFQDYPVLARLVATITDFWVDATGEFLGRLASDWLEIQQIFSAEAELGQIVAVKTSLSDQHRQGRSAIALQFASGLKLVYKPKDLGIEQAYNQLLAWLNDRGAPLSFKLLTAINHSTYGWVEYVEHLPCKDQAEASRYYQRSGMFLCLAYVLKGTDFIDDNIIACREHPVPIDMEMLLNHRICGKIGDEDAYSLAYEQLHSSVLDTAFLPRWLLVSTGQCIDTSGLGGGRQQQTPLKVLKWQNINTDNMALRYEYDRRRARANVPFLDGVNLSPNDYLEEVVDGFRQMYQFLMEHQSTVLGADGPLATLAHQQVRFPFRETKIYSLLLEASLKLEMLRDGADRSIQLDFLSREQFWNDNLKGLYSNSKQDLWQLIKAEQEALEQLDIPLFTTSANSDTVTIAPNQTIEKCFAKPSIHLVIAHFQQLSKEDLEQQINFIRGSLYAHSATQFDGSLLAENLALSIEDVPPLTQKELVLQAVAIATNLQKLAIRSPNGSATWIALGYIIEVERFQLQPLGYNLYDGSCGIALFLAALAKVQGDPEYRDLALAALQSLRQYLQSRESSQAIAKQIGIGGAVGCGSLVYALARISQFLDEPALMNDAAKAAALLTSERLTTDRNYDVISGAAGAILGLLALYRMTGEPEVLEQAILGGHHLLDCRVASDSGFKAWKTLSGKLLTGFSHGAAGIAYALLRLYESSGDACFLEAATEAIAYERSVFSPEAGNWPDLRNSVSRGGKPNFTSSWCHGALGIGIARLGSLGILDTPEVRQDIETALKTTQQVSWQGVDHCCCGNSGRIDLLLTAGNYLSRPELIADAQKQAAWMVTRAIQTGFFRFNDKVQGDTYSPGFYIGTTGIGYELLRLAHPNLLPSVLLWE